MISSPNRARVSACYTFSEAQEAKEELVRYGPLVAVMELREDLHKWYGGGIYRSISAPSSYTHAVCVVGYDDKAGCWICMNSFGNAWGESGFFRIAYGDSSLLTGRNPAYSLDLV